MILVASVSSLLRRVADDVDAGVLRAIGFALRERDGETTISVRVHADGPRDDGDGARKCLACGKALLDTGTGDFVCVACGAPQQQG